MPTITAAIGKAAAFNAVGGGAALDISPTTGTQAAYLTGANTGGSFFLGIESSAGASIIAGSAAYDVVLKTIQAKDILFGTTNAIRGRMTSGGIFAWGTSVITSAAAGDAVIANAKMLRGVNAAASGTIPLIRVDANDIIQVGDAAGGGNMASIGVKTNANLLAAAASANGVVGIDSTNNRFVYYSGGNRYYLLGTSF